MQVQNEQSQAAAAAAAAAKQKVEGQRAFLLQSYTCQSEIANLA